MHTASLLTIEKQFTKLALVDLLLTSSMHDRFTNHFRNATITRRSQNSTRETKQNQWNTCDYLQAFAPALEFHSKNWILLALHATSAIVIRRVLEFAIYFRRVFFLLFRFCGSAVRLMCWIVIWFAGSGNSDDSGKQTTEVLWTNYIITLRFIVLWTALHKWMDLNGLSFPALGQFVRVCESTMRSTQSSPLCSNSLEKHQKLFHRRL